MTIPTINPNPQKSRSTALGTFITIVRLSFELKDYIAPSQFNSGPQQWTAVQGETCSRNILPGQRSNKKTKENSLSLMYEINPIGKVWFLGGLIGWIWRKVD